MSKKITKNIPYKRKRLGKTNYHKRIELLKSQKPRLVIRKSLSNILIQIVEFNVDGDKIVVSAHSNELKKHGWTYSRKNIPACYLTGLILGKKALDKGIKSVVADIGMQSSTKGNKLFSALKGVIDSGMDINFNEKILPDESRLSGQHIVNYCKQLKENESKYKNQFSKDIDYEKLPEQFNSIKDKINKGK